MDITPILNFLPCATPQSWVNAALQNVELLLVDHANCEKKAAATAMNLMYRYVDRSHLLELMSQLAREELLHFEQVVCLLRERNIPYVHLGPSRYAGALRKHIRTHEPARLVDTLIIGAFVEARSCERFAALAPHLDAGLKKFYRSLLRSEARHFEYYLQLATRYAETDVTAQNLLPDIAGSVISDSIRERVAEFAALEKELVCSEDAEFRFHSGVPASTGN